MNPFNGRYSVDDALAVIGVIALVALVLAVFT